MNANIVEFPSKERNLAIAQGWLYLRLLGTKDVAFARYWSKELADTVRQWPEDMAKMRREVAELRRAQK